ncbi:MAG: IS3 family transposase [Mycobacterium sp.]|nr:IS3 family transposase [Mycobacterium sp.]
MIPAKRCPNTPPYWQPSGPGCARPRSRPAVPGVLPRFTQRLLDAGIAPSTGGVGDSFDNALAENLWSAIKVELIYWPATTFATRVEAQAALFRYIDGWYNPRRIQAGLDGLARRVRGCLAGQPAASSPTGYPPT